MNKHNALIEGSELFASVPPGLLAGIAARLEEVHFAAGDVLFERGATGDAVYIVVAGTLSLEVEGRRLLFREPGECVGEFALIDDEPRSTAAVALTDVTVLRWSRDDFQAALARDAGIARGIFRMLTRKLRQDVDSSLRMQIVQERWQQDLARAREIQMGMLPEPDWHGPRLDVAGHCQPAAGVGGDYYDHLHFDAGRTGIIIADVTGHGFYSGLFVAMAKSCVHTQAGIDFTPAAVMAAMRHALVLSIERGLLMTCCYVLLDPRNQRLAYANAGHPYPYLWRAGTGELARLGAIDPLLGVLPIDIEHAYGEVELRWDSGDVLVLYSDGITEARDERREMFGHERLEASIRGLAEQPAAVIRDGILAALAARDPGGPPGDDLTLVVAKAS